MHLTFSPQRKARLVFLKKFVIDRAHALFVQDIEYFRRRRIGGTVVKRQIDGGRFRGRACRGRAKGIEQGEYGQEQGKTLHADSVRRFVPFRSGNA